MRRRPEPATGARRRVLRLGAALCLAGFLALALAAAFATVWRVDSTTTSVAAVDGATGAAVTVPGVLEAREGPVVVGASGEGVITLGVGRQDDVTAWLDADPPLRAARLSGFDPDTGAVDLELPQTAGEGAAAVAPPSAQGSDLWSQEASGEGAAELTHAPTGSADLLVVTSTQGVLRQVSLTWPVVVAHPAALPLAVAGAVAVLAGLAVLVALRWGARERRGPRSTPGPDVDLRDKTGAGPSRGGARSGAVAALPVTKGVPTRRVRLAAVAVLVPALAPAVAGCGAEPLEPRPRPATEVGPALTAPQLAAILDGPRGVAVTVATADAARDGEALTARVDGAALAVRRAGYAVAGGAGSSGELPAARAAGGERMVEAVPPPGAWPRFFVTISSPIDPGAGGAGGAAGDVDAGVPVLEVLTQADPRAPYKLAATASVLPGATFPELVQHDGAVEVVDPARSGLRLAPGDAVAHYADVLTRGGASGHAAEFADASFTASVLAEQDAEAAAGAQYLERTVTHGPREGAGWSLRTSDGGAVVIAVLDSTRTFAATTEGVSLTLPPDVAALGGAAAAGAGSITAAETVVLAVPPEGAQDPVAVVAAHRAFTTVSLS